MKAKDLREMTDAELQQQLGDAKQELFNLRMQRATGQLERPSRLRDVRRNVARVQTVLNQKEKGQESA